LFANALQGRSQKKELHLGRFGHQKTGKKYWNHILMEKKARRKEEKKKTVFGSAGAEKVIRR